MLQSDKSPIVCHINNRIPTVPLVGNHAEFSEDLQATCTITVLSVELFR